MKKLLKTLLTYKFKTKKLLQKKGGFTLIELLVGLIMGALIITPLLGFMINVMSSDRQEQAKSASEQEIQTALDYIGRDLSQAIFIYDGFGLNEIKDELPEANGAEPVLVFWKRDFIKDALPNNDDAFVLSLVAYYQIKDESCTNASTWSCTTRISRVEIKDEVKNPNDSTAPPLKPATPGFAPFESQAPTPPGAPAKSFEQKRNAWTSGLGITDPVNSPLRNVLIDFVDQTTLTEAGLTAECPVTGRALPRPDAVDDPTQPYLYRQVPNYTGDDPVPASFQTGSFYACVSTDKTIAQVFIRGNALARTSPKNNPPTYCPNSPKTFDCSNASAFFPKASIQVQGRGLVTENTTN